MSNEVNMGAEEPGAIAPVDTGVKDTAGEAVAPDNEGKSLMSREASESVDKNAGANAEGKKADAGSADENGKAKADRSADVPEHAESYDLKFSPETRVDAELLGSFRQTALELGLTRAQAQKLAGLYEGHTAKAAERMRAEQTRALLEARKGWEDEITGTPTFQEDQARIQSALRRFGDAELYELLDQTNLGSHPKMWAFMAKVGKALAEPGFHGERGERRKSAAEVLYPDMNG